MRLLTTLLAVALSTTLSARADDLDDASKLLKAGQRDQALERVNRVLAQKKDDPKARFLKGVILTEQGNTREAIDTFTKLTQDYPNLPEPYNNLAVIYAGQGQYDKARAALEQSIRTHPSYATAYENLGDVYAKLAARPMTRPCSSTSRTPARRTSSRSCASWSAARRGAPPRCRRSSPEGSRRDRRSPRRNRRVAAAVREALGGRQNARPSPEGGKRLGPGLVEEGRRCLPRYYAKDFKTPGAKPRRVGKARRERIARRNRSPWRRSAQGDHAGQRPGERHLPAELPVGQAQELEPQDPRDGRADGRWLIREENSK
jgi:tetratricopeptide (TPR) repeat protein